MGYIGALEAAGAKVISDGRFGDWHGSWYAKVEYEGKTLLVGGAYGSCAYCDVYQSTFEYDTPSPEKLIEFGRDYLDDPLVPEVEITSAREQQEYDLDAKPMLEWLTDNF